MSGWRLTAVVWLALALPMGALADLAIAPVQQRGAGAEYAADGLVEAVRQSVVAAQVTGRVTELTVKAGATVRAGEVLARIDARTAVDQSAAARAQLASARKEYERSRALFAQQFISQAALDRAEAQYKALRAQAGAADTATVLHTIVAPYAGIVATTTVEVGDMALPGRPLLTVYDPLRLRVLVALPEAVAAAFDKTAPVKIDIPGASDSGARAQIAQSIEILPTADAGSHTLQARLNLSEGLRGIAPGQFARAYLPLSSSAPGQLVIPKQAVVRRSEVFGVYVVDAQGHAQLRQVRLGRERGDVVEVLAGVSAGERVALDPLAAAKQQ